MSKSTISATERIDYLDLQYAASRIGLSSYGIDAAKELIGFRIETGDNQVQPVFHKDDLEHFKKSVYYQVLSKIDLFTDSDYSYNYEPSLLADEKLTEVINRVQEQHLLRTHKEANWDKFKVISCCKASELLSYAQAASYLGNIPLDELDELIFTGKIFSKRLSDSTGTYWIFKKVWLEEYKALVYSEPRLEKLIRLVKALRKKK